MINQINTQKDFGPLEPLSEYIKASNYPSEAVISIGATRYTNYGETTFLNSGDDVIIIVYNHKTSSLNDVMSSIKTTSYNSSKMSVLSQKVL